MINLLYYSHSALEGTMSAIAELELSIAFNQNPAILLMAAIRSGSLKEYCAISRSFREQTGTLVSFH